VGTGKVYFMFVDFHFGGTTKNFKKNAHTFACGDELCDHTLISFKEAGDDFDVIAYFMRLVWDLHNTVGGKESKFDHNLGLYMHRHAFAPDNVGYTACIMDISQMLNRIEAGKEIAGEQRFERTGFCFPCPLGTGEKDFHIVKGG
jgi:hypothetical protein